MWFEFHLQKLHFLNQAGYYLGIAKKTKKQIGHAIKQNNLTT